jgi:hypothetical protein
VDVVCVRLHWLLFIFISILSTLLLTFILQHIPILSISTRADGAFYFYLQSTDMLTFISKHVPILSISTRADGAVYFYLQSTDMLTFISQHFPILFISTRVDGVTAQGLTRRPIASLI